MSELNAYEQKLLDGWEDVHKKSQLTLWIMLSLKDGPKHMSEIKQFIQDATKGMLSADDQSMYRALRRYHDADMVEYHEEPSDSGPDLKVYSLTDIGRGVLQHFVARNVEAIFYDPDVKQLLQG